MTKTSFLSWINIILLPIIVNYFFRDNFYGATGLAGVIFDYHISAIASGLTLKLIDPLTLIFKILLLLMSISQFVKFELYLFHLFEQLLQVDFIEVDFSA